MKAAGSGLEEDVSPCKGMVGFVTAPMEIKFFSRRETLVRNGLSFIFSFLVAAVMGVVFR